MRHIFVDLGCHDGDTVKEFRNWKSLAYPDSQNWEIYAFDPSPLYVHDWQKQTLPWIKFEQKAAWINNQELDYSLYPVSEGSSIMREKDGWYEGQIMKVPCLDFSAWLKQFKDCHVIVKMDIEGAEFPVLKKMIEDGTDRLVHKLFVEFHDSKLGDYETHKDWIVKNLKCKWHHWR